MKAEQLELEPGVVFSYYYRKGTPVTLVFIHGLGDWKETHLRASEYPKLSKYGMLMVDQIGYGDSSHPDGFNYTMKEQAQAIKLLMDKLGIDDVVLIPHSMGGPVAVDLAELYGSRVKGIIYAEGNVDFNDCFFSNWIITEHSYDQWVNETFPSLLERYKKNPSQVNYTVSFGKAGAISTYKSSEDLVAVSKKDDIKDRLAALKVPVLAVFGEKNRGKFTSEAKLGEAFPLVFIPDAAHSMMVDNPDAYYREIAIFLEKILK
jgi:pimeloyl-ACP methyl ester carboxylesterase